MTDLLNEKINEFCELVLRIGVNIQVGQGLEIICPIEKKEYAHALTKKAYELGAKIVRVRWEDEELSKINLELAKTEALKEVPKWQILQRNYLVENNFCYIAIDADDPNAFKDIPATKLAEISKEKSKKFKKFSDNVMTNAIRWCVVSVPTPKWAKLVFPKSKNPLFELSNAIALTMRLDSENPVKAWEKHIENLEKRAKFLNENNFEYLHYENKLGTNLKVYLADNHVWLSAKEKAKDNVEFVANMPTEEIFTAPHCFKTEGIVYSALPLSYNGQLIEDFSLTFKKGKIVDFTAKKGYDTLKQLIETDKGTYRIGEVALIGKNSPIAKSKILYFNTLFDENASCHLALGKGYPTTVKNGASLSVKDLLKLGVNDSVEHVDFMVGTPDLNIFGVKKDGTIVKIFVDGEWVI